MGKIIFKFRKIWRSLSHIKTANALLFHRVAAALEHQGGLRALRCKVVVDIGANRGQFSLAARQFYPEATIISFEPLPGPASIYRRIFQKDQKVRLHQAAIGTESGTSEIHVSRRDDSSSLLPISQLQTTLFPGTEESSVVEINIGRLSDYIQENELESPALLKLDVQGYELEALKGSENLLTRFDYVYVECSFIELYQGQVLANDVIQHLNNHGFKLKGIYNLSYDHDGIAIQGDFLFSR